MASAAIAILLLGLDILTGAKGLAGVLYVPLLVAVATEAGRREVAAFGALGVAFALAAFLVASRTPHRTIAPWPLAVGLASVVVTSVLLARLVGARDALQDTNRQLAYSNWRYDRLFEQSRFPFFERDFTEVLATYDRLRAQGVTDLADYGARHPGFAEQLAAGMPVVKINDAMLKLLGANSRDDFPKTLAQMMPHAEDLFRLQQRLFDGHRRLDGKTSLTRLDGEMRDVWVTSEFSPDPARAGVMAGFLVDLTESERARRVLAAAQAELARASRAATIGAFSASIAHELNQPLAATVINAQTSLRYLRRETPDLAAAISALERTVSEGARAAEIVQHTRDMVASREGHVEDVDMKALALEVVSLLDHDIQAANIKVAFEWPETKMRLSVDRVAFQQVLVNLVGNAVHAVRDRGGEDRRLAIGLSSSAQEMTIQVRDSGSGITPENLERLFEPFFTTREGGVGVGLAISRAAVEARGGSLEGRNALGGGAVFECRIPLALETV